MPPLVQISNETTKKPNSKSIYESQEDLIDLLTCVDDPLFFMRRFMKLQHPLEGMVPFNPYPFQERMIRAFHENRMTIALTARQMGKTSCAAGYLLWKAMFNPDVTILIAANKFVMALEIMDRVRYAYEHLPDHIRAGVAEYNKSTITFDNNSRIIARATSADAGRGLAITLLFVDEFAFVMPNKQEEFWTSMQPVLSTGGSCIITSTPKNDEDQFAQIWKGANTTIDEVGNPLPNGQTRNGWFPVLAPWWEHPERDETWAAPFRQTLGEARFQQEFCCVSAKTKLTIRRPDGNIVILTMAELCEELQS